MRCKDALAANSHFIMGEWTSTLHCCSGSLGRSNAHSPWRLGGTERRRDGGASVAPFLRGSTLFQASSISPFTKNLDKRGQIPYHLGYGNHSFLALVTCRRILMATQLQTAPATRLNAQPRPAPAIAPSVSAEPFSLDQELMPFGTWTSKPIWVPPKDSATEMAQIMLDNCSLLASRDECWSSVVPSIVRALRKSRDRIDASLHPLAQRWLVCKRDRATGLRQDNRQGT